MKNPAKRLIPIKKTATYVPLVLLALIALPATANDACKGDCLSEMLTFAYIADMSGDVKFVPGTRETAQELITSATVERVECALDKPAGSLGTGWKTVWGPAVWGPKLYKKATKEILDHAPANTMFVARYKTTNIYVVAVAGTNPESSFDWEVEDLHIHPTPWPGTKFSDQTSVTRGTLIGLESLRGMRPEAPAQAVGVDLYDFLKGVTAQWSANNKATIYVTGHSLGGALAPAVALWLSDERQGSNSAPGWDPSNHTTLQIYAFAGPTPGNDKFADYVQARFPGDPSAGPLTQDGMKIINNSLDVAPHAFNLASLQEISGLYEPYHMKSDVGVSLALQEIVQRVERSGVSYQLLGKGSQVSRISKVFATRAGLRTICLATRKAFAKHPLVDDFRLEALYQHVCAYPLALRVERLLEELDSCTWQG